MTKYRVNKNVNNFSINLLGGASTFSNPYGNIKLPDNFSSFNLDVDSDTDSKTESSLSAEDLSMLLPAQPKINLDLYKFFLRLFLICYSVLLN